MLQVEDYIPHRDRMRMIDEVLEVDDSSCRARAKVLGTWPLSDGKSVHSIIIIELIAQTVGISIGWGQKKKNRPVGSGMIVGIKSATFAADGIPVGHTVTITAKKVLDRDNYGTFAGTAEAQGRVLGSAEIQLYRTE